MISELLITDLDRSCVHHARDVPFFKGRTSVEFKPGLNILWGGNGAGKSTILSAIARMLHCEQGGRSVVTRDSLDAVFTVPGTGATSRIGDWSETMAAGLVPVHDGQCVLHVDPGHAVGLMMGGAAFDWDFGDQGIANTMFRGSSGQTTSARINAALKAIIRGPKSWPTTEWKVGKTSKRTEQVDEYLKGTLPAGFQPTVLLDEPDRSLSMKLQAGMWTNLAAKFTNIQVIAASHSPFALRLPGVNYIEMTPGYLAECEEVVDMYLLGELRPNRPA